MSADLSLLGWFIIAIAIGFVLYDMLMLWAALRASALAGQRAEQMLIDDDDDLDEPEYPPVVEIED